MEKKKKGIVISVLGSASRQSRRSGHEVELSHWPSGVLALRHWLPCFLQPCMCCRLGAQHFLVSPDLRELWRLRGSVSIAARTAFGHYLEQIYRKLRGFKPKLLGQRATSRWWKRYDSRQPTPELVLLYSPLGTWRIRDIKHPS